MVPECTHILPNGRKCAQFALRGQPFCSPHMDPERRRRSEELLALVDSIAEMDLEALLDAMIGITSERLQRQIPHAHFDTACVAALDRLQALKAESRQASHAILMQFKHLPAR
jgi:hypothetical protein